MASYVKLALSFLKFLYDDATDEETQQLKWIQFAEHDDSTKSLNTGYFTRVSQTHIFWNLSFTLIAIITTYAIVLVCKNSTYRSYIRRFRPTNIIKNVLLSIRNRFPCNNHHRPTTQINRINN